MTNHLKTPPPPFSVLSTLRTLKGKTDTHGTSFPLFVMPPPFSVPEKGPNDFELINKENLKQTTCMCNI